MKKTKQKAFQSGKYGIKQALLQFAKDEGKKSALMKIDDWIPCLEELLEISNKSQQRAITVYLLDPIRKIARQLLKE